MGESKYTKAIYVQKLLLTITGIWPKKDFGIWYTFYGSIISCVFPIIFVILDAMTILAESTDLFLKIFTLFTMLSMFTITLKVIIFYFKKNTLNDIIKDLEQPLFNNYQDHLDVYMKNCIRIANRIRKLVQYSIFLAISILFVYPIFESSKRGWPFDLSINTSDLPFSLYVLGYIFEVITAFAISSNDVGIDTLICGFISLGVAQCQMLRKNLKNSASIYQSTIINGSLNRSQDIYKTFDKEVAENLKKCIKHHMAITEYVSKLEAMFTYIFLAQFLSAIVIISLTGFGLLMIPVASQLFVFSILYIIVVTSEVSLFCLFGDELMIQSSKISDACYMSEWNNCGPEVRKTLFIIMEKSKRPLVLTTGKFVVVSRESLTKILKSSASYFAVLRTIYKGPE